MENYDQDIIDSVQECIQNVCENYNVPTGINLSRILQSREQPEIFICSMEVTTSVAFVQDEIFKNLRIEGVKSKKDYRHLKQLIRLRLANSARSLKFLAEETLTNLGFKE